MMRRSLYIGIGSLAVCLSFLAGRVYRSGSGGANAGGRRVLYYLDPMHPAYKSDKPGIAPDCGMKLVPVYEGDSEPSTSQHIPIGTVSITPEKQQAMGIRVEPAKDGQTNDILRVTGRVTPDERDVYRVTAAVDGWVRTSGEFVSGSVVKKGDVLATYYNRDVLTAQQTYLYALNTMDRYKDGSSEDQLKLTHAQIQAAEDNLESLGMDEIQVHQVAATRKLVRNVELRSPVSGIVLARNVYTGLRFERGTELFRVAALDHVWVVANLFENEASYFRTGAEARVTIPRQNKHYEATVSDIPPLFDAATRTLQVRLDVKNPGYLLRPEMFVDVELPIRLPPGVTVPVDAVMHSGLHHRVFVDRGNGYFEPREVETGWRRGERMQIVRGLASGERIIVSGTFLVDSESRMKAAAEGIYSSAVKDPVCGMGIDHDRAVAAGRKTEYNGETFYFCSDQCKRKFDAAPAQYSAPMNKHQAKRAALRLTSAAPEQAVDPVCGMNVETAKAMKDGRVFDYEGKTYHFCSKGCKESFQKEPQKYLAPLHAEGGHD